jgi:valyl-tRNA synthetase
MGWPEKTPTLAAFYPTSTLVTGFDILFFWVARMMMMGLKMTGEVPFYDIYLHAMVRDEHGQKMSKTKGNVIDPLEIIDEFGADALRFTLAIMTLQGRDVNLAPARIAGYRNFLNKVWNALRFVHLTIEGNAPGGEFRAEVKGKGDLPDDPASRWIRSRLARAIEANIKGYEEYEFSALCSANYRFFWDEFCSWYLEIAKLQLKEGGDKRRILNALVMISDVSLRLLHPAVPFITEELWSELPELNGAKRSYLQRAKFPSPGEFGDALSIDPAAEEEVEMLQEVVSAVRTCRSENAIPPGTELDVVLSGDAAECALVLKNAPLVRGLGRIGSLSGGAINAAMKKAAVRGITVGIILPKLERTAAGAAKQDRERARLEAEIEKIEGKLGSESFLAKAPPDVVEKERRKLAECRAKVETLR